MVAVDELARGLGRGCVCPNCRNPLNARKGALRVSDFVLGPHLPQMRSAYSRSRSVVASRP